MVRKLLVLVALMSSLGSVHAQTGRWLPIGTHNTPPKAQKIFAGGARAVYFVDAKGGVYESQDGCENWSIVTGIPGSERIYDYWVSPTGYLLGRSDTAVYWTRDGDFWTLLPHYDTLFNHRSIDCAAIDNNGTPYFGISYKGIYRLRDDAQGFTMVVPLTFASIKEIEFDLSNRMYTLGDSIVRYNASFRVEKKWAHRADFGDRLYRVSSTMLVIGDSIRMLEPKFEATSRNEWGSYVVDSSGGLVYLNGYQVARSTDFGVTWTSSGPFPVDYGDPVVATRSGLVVQRPSATIAISVDSEKTFTELQALNDQLTFLAIFVDGNGWIHAYDSLDGHWISKNGGRYWSLSKHPRTLYIDPSLPLFAGWGGTIYWPTTHVVGTLNWREVLASDDNGETFHAMPHPPLPGASNYNVFPVGPGELYSYSDTHIISHSSDNGVTWKDLGDFVDSNNAFITKNPDQIVGFVRHDSLLWAASESSLFETTNSGAFWRLQPGPLPGSGAVGGDNVALWCARDRSILAQMGPGSPGYNWLSYNERPSRDTYIQCGGPIVQTGDSDLLGMVTYRRPLFYEDEFIHVHRGHDLIDTLVRGPDSLIIRGMALDSAGNLYGIGYPSPTSHSMGLRGIYKFYPTGSGVKPRQLAGQQIDISIDGRTVRVTSPSEFTEVTIANVLGEVVSREAFSPRTEWISQTLPGGMYLLQVRSNMVLQATKFLIR